MHHRELIQALTNGDVSRAEKLWDQVRGVQNNLNVLYSAAALSGSRQMVKFIWSKGVPVDYYDGEALIYLCSKISQKRGQKRINQINMVRYLIRSGIPANVRGGEACIVAARNGDLELLQILVARDANPRAQQDHALCLAVCNDHPHVVEYLLELGADANAEEGEPMLFAAERGHVACARLLVQHGADVNVRGGACLNIAEENGHLEMVKFLAENGCCEDLVQFGETMQFLDENRDWKV